MTESKGPEFVPEARPIAPAPAVSNWSVRAVGLALVVGATAVLYIAVRLPPDPRGFGTHEAMGTGPCGMLVTTGLPCPTCGMTTAFAYFVRGQLLHAIWAQPAGAVLAAGTVLAALFGLWILTVGRMPAWWWRIDFFPVFVGALVLLLGAWGYKIVEGLITHTLPYR